MRLSVLVFHHGETARVSLSANVLLFGSHVTVAGAIAAMTTPAHRSITPDTKAILVDFITILFTIAQFNFYNL
jgi:nicotinate-nucleotide pyrophosphorylase